MQYQNIIQFWFETLTPKQWWVKDIAIDKRIKQHFSDVHQQAATGKLSAWRGTDEGRLAEIIVLDQFSRNMFRDQADAFAFDALALDLCKAAVENGAHQRLPQTQVNFLLMPFMHSESLTEHQHAADLFKQYASEGTADFEQRHYAIIKRFGRYPHRNAILDRNSTSVEIDFLDKPGSSF